MKRNKANNGNFNEGTGGHCLNVHLATKEQCEQLEKAMADAEYTFDFGKKELRTIEQNLARLKRLEDIWKD